MPRLMRPSVMRKRRSRLATFISRMVRRDPRAGVLSRRLAVGDEDIFILMTRETLKVPLTSAVVRRTLTEMTSRA